jgi:hypothetical protein
MIIVMVKESQIVALPMNGMRRNDVAEGDAAGTKKRPPRNPWSGLTLGVFSRNMRSLFKNQI